MGRMGGPFYHCLTGSLARRSLQEGQCLSSKPDKDPKGTNIRTLPANHSCAKQLSHLKGDLSQAFPCLHLLYRSACSHGLAPVSSAVTLPMHAANVLVQTPATRQSRISLVLCAWPVCTAVQRCCLKKNSQPMNKRNWREI